MYMQPFSKQDVLDSLRKICVMSVALYDGEKPLISTLLFAVDDDFNFMFVTKENTRKMRALQANRSVSFAVWDADKMLIEAAGEAIRLSDESELDRAMEQIASSAAARNNFWPPILQYGKGEHYAVFSIKVNWMRVLDLRVTTISSRGELFTEFKFHE